ncbi:MAG TPA: universal stress protein [Pyrinomonadaceae bacterium]|nr:universal stress protein [Pyrinomonadaceae bacterium]
MLTSPEILVPVDFSACSVNALRIALGMAAPDGDLTLLHVIDQQFIDEAVSTGLGTEEDIRTRMREQAENSFASMLEELNTGQIDVEKMIVVGAPFVEILKITRDLDLPMVVMGVRGRSTPPEEILFGSTAEKVLRGTRVPVLFVPL